MSAEPTISQAPAEPADHRRVAAAIEWLVANWRDQPSLEAAAAAVGASPFHLQRRFAELVGVSPKKFVQHLTIEHAKPLLDDGADVLGASLDVGLSSPSRLHDAFVAVQGMTPGEWKAQGAGTTIRWGLHDTPFGPWLIAAAERGVCAVTLAADGTDAALDHLSRRFKGARLVEDAGPGAAAAAALRGARPDAPLRLMLKGTPFQIRVWEALLRIPLGRTATYAQIAAAVGAPGATRAVGNAVGDNPIGVLIPCHRVLRKSGAIGGYYWGPEKKRALLAWETARAAGE